MMDEHGKSDRFVVPKNSPNNVPERTAEAKEGRERTKGNTPERNASRTQGRLDAPSALERVRQAAKRDKKQRFTALLHHVYAIEDAGRDDNGGGGERRGGHERRVYRMTNNGTAPVDTHLLVVAVGLSYEIEMTNASGRTSAGDPYLRVFLPNGVLTPGQSIDVALRFKRHAKSPPVSFTVTLLSGQGSP